MAPGLQNIPAELQVLVAGNVDKKDLLALRLTSRELAAACEEPFLAAFFAKRNHLLTKQSLEVLVSITSNDRMRSAIKSLTITVPQITKRYKPDHSSWRYLSSKRDKETLQFYQDRSHVWDRWLQQARDLTRDACGKLLLIRAFHNLSRQPCRISMHIQSRLAYKYFRAYGQEALSAGLGAQLQGFNNSTSYDRPLIHHESATSMLLESITVSKIQPTELEILGPEVYGSPYNGVKSEPRSLPSMNILMPELRHSLSHLTTLSLGHVANFVSLPGEWNDAFLAALALAAPHIIRLNVAVPDKEDQVLWFVNLFKCIRPRELKLNLWCSPEEYGIARTFATLLRSQCTTLSRLTTVGFRCYLKKPAVGAVLGWIARNMSLDFFEAVELEGKRISAEGSENIRSTLLKFEEDGHELYYDEDLYDKIDGHRAYALLEQNRTETDD